MHARSVSRAARPRQAALALAALLLGACASTEPKPSPDIPAPALSYARLPAYQGVKVFRLYRSSAGVPGETVKLAVFDSLAGKRYTPNFNQHHCEKAARLLQEADEYGQRYWCEEVG